MLPVLGAVTIFAALAAAIFLLILRAVFGSIFVGICAALSWLCAEYGRPESAWVLGILGAVTLTVMLVIRRSQSPN